MDNQEPIGSEEPEAIGSGPSELLSRYDSIERIIALLKKYGIGEEELSIQILEDRPVLFLAGKAMMFYNEQGFMFLTRDAISGLKSRKTT